jgi:F0F1-type ATP synthase assembly protein I
MDEKPSPGIYDLMTMGISSAAMIGVATVLGLLVDDWAHTSPLGVLLGLAFGLVAGVGNIYFHFKKYL